MDSDNHFIFAIGYDKLIILLTLFINRRNVGMQSYKNLIVLLVSLSCVSLHAAQFGKPSVDLVELVNNSSRDDEVFKFFIQRLDKILPYVALSVAGIYTVSKLQKSNPEFFSNMWRLSKSPLVFVQRSLERYLCAGESLSWNQVTSWHNRILKVLTPLTKQTALIDIAKVNRLKKIEDEEKSEGVDQVWQATVHHIESELCFINTMLERHLNYYQDQEVRMKKQVCECCACHVYKKVAQPSLDVLKRMGKNCIRVSLKRHEEIAFYIKKIITYNTQIIAYLKTVSYSHNLHKEHVKACMNDVCGAFEHLAVLVDESTAAAPRGVNGQLLLAKAASQTSYASGYQGYGGTVAEYNQHY